MVFIKKAIVAIVAVILFASVFVAASAQSQAAEDKGPLEKITFIHYKKGFEKSAAGPAKAKPVSCYGYLASGAKWKTIEPYLVNPTNSDGLNQNFVFSAVTAGAAEWEKYGGNIFGEASIDYDAQYVEDKTDGKNTVSFGNYPNNGVIAVTNVWGYFGGSPRTRQLVEWDMLFNDTYFTFGDATATPSLMDLQNIATHEIGHSAGMNDQYSTKCYLETMYGYSSEGDIAKRDLYTEDITGIRKLYGS